MRWMLRGKIHRAVVTETDISYEGSVTIDADLMARADILPYEKVHLLDVDNGARLETYAMPGPPGSGVVCVNGAAARLVHRGDKVIVLAYTLLPDEDAGNYRPKIVRVDEKNRPLVAASLY